MRTKIVIIGLGNVGTTILYNLYTTKKNLDILLIDNHIERAKGIIIDLEHTLNKNNNVLVLGNYSKIDDANVIIIASGIRLLDNREEFLQKSFLMIKEIVDNIKKTSFNGNIIVVSNPNDVITSYVASNYQKEKVIGTGTSLDTNRLKYYLSKKYNVDFNKINASVIGEHGFSQVILFDNIKINNKLIKLTKEEQEEISNYVKNIALEIVSLKGYTNFGIANCVSQIIDLIINYKEEFINISSFDSNNNIAYSVKSKIINGEVKRIMEKEDLLKDSIKKIKKEYKIFNKSKVIGIDLDDTITYLKDEMEKEARIFDKKINGKGIIDDTKYLVGEKYGWKKEDLDKFFRLHRIKVINNAKVRSDARFYLNKLIEQGYEIIIITARNSKYYDNPYEYTKNWLDKNNIPYTKLIVNAKSKREICERENVSVFIDDMPNNCLDVNELSNVKVFIMDNKDNYLDDDGIVRIYNFKELYEEII